MTRVGWPTATATSSSIRPCWSGRPHQARGRAAPARTTQKNSRPNHPTTCGKVERFQQTRKNGCRAQPEPPATPTELQTLLDTFRQQYNDQRPHAGTHIRLLVQDLDITIVDAVTGEILRELLLDPTRDYQPAGRPMRTLETNEPDLHSVGPAHSDVLRHHTGGGGGI